MLVPAAVAWHGHASLPSNLRYDSAAEDVVLTYAPSDPASYVRYGRYLLSRGEWDIALTGCWPPGMGAVNAAIFFLVGEDGFVRNSMVVAVVLWGVALYGVFRSLSVPRPAMRFVLLNAIWAASSFRYWLLITAPIYSESRTIPIFVIAVTLLVRALQTRRQRSAVGSAVAFAACAYLRGVFDSLVLIGFGAIATVALARVALSYAVEVIRTSRLPSPRDGVRWFLDPRFGRERRALKLAVVVIVTASALVIPWKVRNLALLGMFSLMTCHPLAYVAYWSSDRPSYLISRDAACVANPELCEILNARIEELTPDLARRLILFTMVDRPVAYAATKLRYFTDFWIGTSWDVVGVKNRAFLVEGLLSLGAGFVTVVWAARTVVRQRGPRAVFSAFVLGFCLQNVLVFTLFHYEYRYSAPVRLFFLLSPWWLASLPVDDAAAEPSGAR